MTEQTGARELFQAAYEHRYTWDENFPGYSADVEIKQGDEVYSGSVRINSDLTVEVTGFSDEKVQESVYNQMRDIVTHRKRSSFAQAHGKNEFSLGETDSTGAVEISVKGDAMGSNYKVRGKEISQVSRVMGPMAFTINTNSSLDTGEGYLSSGYNAIFRNAKTGELKGKREFEDTFEKFGDYYVMTHQVVEAIEGDSRITTEFTFSNIRLLAMAVV
ncbi:DUF3386 domain-containing protein [Limnofasciculus baicalensis]|uniref:DUF3386 domain-containing protein n=1 Tax=Limnofasciculus baicalensis BBK-W-15 TaxID=2699891 RepID=A0AAE3KPQ4_9CYAN|nr:DUF3386 domain-containing protein [Limnofasciculus baicalensis]MCP2731790.1 DUF3386 domain-containing protein [Limnofasciculus baicalensis BBK-W-15]